MKWLRWFLAGAIAVPLFHQGLLFLLNVAGVIDRAPFGMTPTKPFGVPSLISLAFWGGVWGILLGLVLIRRTGGASFWITALVFGAIAPTLVAMFVVPPLKGKPISLEPMFFVGGMLLNGAWGIGTAVLYRLTTPRSERLTPNDFAT